MELHVFDPSFTYRGRVQNWINMTWTEEYRGEGKFTLTTYDTDQYAELLRQGYFFYRSDRPVAMMAVKVERNTDENTITVCGYTTLHLLTRRIIDLPHEFVNIESGIYIMIQKDLRNLPGVVTAPVKGLTAEFKCNIEGVVLLDGVFEMLNESSYGIRANFDYANKRHVIEVYDGVDRTYDSQHGGTVFSQEFGNLKSLTVEEDDDLYKNVAYVTGSSDNDPATVYYQYVSPYAGDQANWREMLVSGENQESGESIEEWQDRQEQIAKKALQGYKSALAFEVELGLGVFGEKYDLGDKVTCKSKRYGLQFDTQIMEYQYSYKQGVEKVKVVLGDRPLDYVQSSIAKSSGSGGGMKITGGGSSSGTPGEPGKDGEDGVGIASVVQTTTSTADNGENIVTVTLTDGSANYFSVRNGSKGSKGDKGDKGDSCEEAPHNYAYDGKDLSTVFASAAELHAAVAAGDFSNIRVGDYWPVTLSGSYTDYGDNTTKALSNAVVKLEVAGIDTYISYGDTALTSHHLVMCSRDCLPNTTKWRTANTTWTDTTTQNPWRGSAIYKTLNTGILPLVSATDIGTYIFAGPNGNGMRVLGETKAASATTATAWSWLDRGRLFLPTEREIWGQSVWSELQWGANPALQWPIFSGSFRHVIKRLGNGGSRCAWWLASSGAGRASNACSVSYSGVASDYSAGDAYGLALCFLLT